jgi:hypothetical protein
MRENDPSTKTNIKIKVYAAKVVSIANLNDFLRNNWLFTQTSKDPASNPETTPYNNARKQTCNWHKQ